MLNAGPGLRLTLILAALLIYSTSILALGMRSGQRQDKLFTYVRDAKRLFIAPEGVSFGYLQTNEFQQVTHYFDKVEVEKPAITQQTMAVFAFGQSNSANHGGERSRAQSPNIVNYWDNKYYRAADPLLGASGVGGSVWTNLANKLLEADKADNIILVTAGIDGTSVKEWRRRGRLHAMLRSRLDEVKRVGIPITHLLWHQGEVDHAMDANEYSQGLNEVILTTREFFPDAKFFVAQASRCDATPPSQPILDAQRRATAHPNVFLGPNTDTIDNDDRYDGCHLSGRGLERHANLWMEALEQEQSVRNADRRAEALFAQ